MFAIGWICVQEAEYPDIADYPTSEPRDHVIALVRAAIARHLDATWPEFEQADLRHANGTWTLQINAHRNHRKSWPTALFSEIGELAAGSFGHLHLWDDEHPTEDERFMRWTMVHGVVTAEEDIALRPVVARWFDRVDDANETEAVASLPRECPACRHSLSETAHLDGRDPAGRPQTVVLWECPHCRGRFSAVVDLTDPASLSDAVPLPWTSELGWPG
ncbi:hypothetical protein DSM112329_02872 [Paraconexibacter sp. AEG42_29]|uniref:Uncharacterized protein n=1 Tax=Paraconexibacter sp. AEG42_29 TaxID=2997339 RepID=A0AAU7AWI8_9ACTN